MKRRNDGNLYTNGWNTAMFVAQLIWMKRFCFVSCQCLFSIIIIILQCIKYKIIMQIVFHEQNCYLWRNCEQSHSTKNKFNCNARWCHGGRSWCLMPTVRQAKSHTRSRIHSTIIANPVSDRASSSLYRHTMLMSTIHVYSVHIVQVHSAHVNRKICQRSHFNGIIS